MDSLRLVNLGVNGASKQALVQAAHHDVVRSECFGHHQPMQHRLLGGAPQTLADENDHWRIRKY